MELKVLFIEDDDKLRQNLKKSFDKETIAGYIISADDTGAFEEGINLIKAVDYDIVILDLFKDKDIKDEEAGKKVLNEIRKNVFVPVIFYTGHAYKIMDLASEIVGIVSKGDGIEKLIAEINRIITTKIALLKKNINEHVKESLRKYFWETVDTDKKIFTPNKNDFSLGYLLLRRLANSLSKENIKELLGDAKIKIDKAHPMEFYIYPTEKNDEYKAGEIVLKNNEWFALLTPTCDFIERAKKDGSKERRVGKVLLVKAISLKNFPQYNDFKANSSKENRNKIITLLTNNVSDRYFFLPTTPFIENMVLDFQNKTMVDFEDLATFNRIAKLDDPFAQSMVSSFIRYYNRIGFPDIDSDYIIANL